MLRRKRGERRCVNRGTGRDRCSRGAVVCVSVRGENVDSSCKKSENEGGSVTMETIVNLS
jgi:hypothetical protein